jgi:PglZ domain
MHPLHDDVARLLGERLKARSIVVWYDTRGEFQAFVDELRGGPAAAADPASVMLPGGSAQLAQFNGSMFELRAFVEPSISSETPPRLVIYVPGVPRDDVTSVLMEMEKAGERWEIRLKTVARNVLRRKYTDGDIDRILNPESVTYADIARAAEGSSEGGPSLLKGIFHEASGGDAIIAAWLMDDERDGDIEQKQAVGELVRLIASRLGLELAEADGLVIARAGTLRHVLGGEFRSDLNGPAPSSLEAVPAPRTKDDESAIRSMAQRLRTTFAAHYAEVAGRVETELGLTDAAIAASALGSIDTFAFEERIVYAHCADLIASRSFAEALTYVSQRDGSFWLLDDLERGAQWEALRRMAEVGRVAVEVMAEVRSAGGKAEDWVEQYSASEGWQRLDLAQRRMETFVVKLADEPPERAIGVVRRTYEETTQAMAEGFSKVLAQAGWTVPGVLRQTHVYDKVVADQPTPVAYFLADAMRFEMGAELAQRLPASSEVRIRAAVAALPSITPVGMAALQPGAAASFDVVTEGGKFGSRIDGSFLPDVAARRRFAASRVPGLVDLTLGEVLTFSKVKLASHVSGAKVVVVRSQEIDDAGEGGFAHIARQTMDAVIDDLVRAIRKLADAGIEQAVLSADHGHLFAHGDREEAMRVESPGGDKVQLHRRCWIGRGGATPAGCVRVSASELGYDSDLEFVFPRGAGVFKAGGDLGFHHGGPSLQEIVVPVITVRSAPVAAAVVPSKDKLMVSNLPYEITNRIFSVVMELGAGNLALFSSTTLVKPVLLSGAAQVGAAGMAIGGDLDLAAGTVAMQPGKPVTVGFLLSADEVDAVRIVVRDPETDAELYRAPADIPVRLGVN